MKIYVGNLSFNTTEHSLRELFGQHGDVDEVSIITDRETGRSRGFSFVTMPNDGQAQAAMSALNGTDLDGRALNVNAARARTGTGGGQGGGRRDRL